MWFFSKAADPTSTRDPTLTMELSISLARPVNLSGHQLNGLVNLHLKGPARISAIYLTFKGSEHAAFWLWDRESSNDDASLVKKEGKHSWVQLTIPIPSFNPDICQLEEGNYQFPFSFLLPSNLPSSFHHEFPSNGGMTGFGTIAYTLTAHLTPTDPNPNPNSKPSHKITCEIYKPPSHEIIKREQHNLLRRPDLGGL